MLCSISGAIPEEPVLSPKSGLLFEKRLIEKILRDTGKCPVTHERLSPDNLLPVKINKSVEPRIAPAASIPGLLGLFHNEWDALMLENYHLRQQLALNRQELALALYQHDAACRVVSRVLRERNEARDALATVQAVRPSTTEENICIENEGNEQFECSIPTAVINIMLKKSTELSSKRKKFKVSPTLATADTLRGYKCSSLPLHETLKGIFTLDSSEDGGIVTGGEDGQILNVPNSSNGPVCRISSPAKEPITSVRFAADGHTLISASRSGEVKLWSRDDSASFSVSATYQHSAGVVSAHVHPTLKFVVSVCNDKKWQLWDVSSGNVVVVQGTLSGNYTAAELHPDGLIIGTGTDESEIKLSDFRVGGKEVACFPHQSKLGGSGLSGPVFDISFSGNGYLMSSAAEDGAMVWDLRKLSCVAHIETLERTRTVRFDQTGGYLAVGSTNLRICSVKQGFSVAQEFRNIGKNNVRSVCFGTDASFVAIGSEDHVLRIFSQTCERHSHC